MEKYDKNTKSSYLEYLDLNKQYGWAMSEKLPVHGFKWIEEEDISKFNEKFIKNYDENSDLGYTLEVHVEYPINICMQHSDLAFLPERIKVNKQRNMIMIW